MRSGLELSGAGGEGSRTTRGQRTRRGKGKRTNGAGVGRRRARAEAGGEARETHFPISFTATVTPRRLALYTLPKLPLPILTHSRLLESSPGWVSIAPGPRSSDRPRGEEVFVAAEARDPRARALRRRARRGARLHRRRRRREERPARTRERASASAEVREGECRRGREPARKGVLDTFQKTCRAAAGGRTTAAIIGHARRPATGSSIADLIAG